METTLAHLDDAPCGVAALTARGAFLQANRTFCEWSGYAQDELIGTLTFEELLSVDGRRFYRAHWLPTITLQRSISDVTLELRRRDGTLLPVVANARRRATEDGVIDEIALMVAEDPEPS